MRASLPSPARQDARHASPAGRSGAIPSRTGPGTCGKVAPHLGSPAQCAATLESVFRAYQAGWMSRGMMRDLAHIVHTAQCLYHTIVLEQAAQGSTVRVEEQRTITLAERGQRKHRLPPAARVEPPTP